MMNPTDGSAILWTRCSRRNRPRRSRRLRSRRQWRQPTRWTDDADADAPRRKRFRPMIPLRVKFEASIATKDNGCVEWVKARNARGYGVVRDETGKNRLAHRAAWFLAFGYYSRQHILHRCDNPACVRIDHLFEGSHVDNMADKMAKGRHRWGHRKWTPNEPKPWAKLTLDQVIAIKKAAEPQWQLAVKYGVSQQTISDIRRGRRWPHAEVAA